MYQVMDDPDDILPVVSSAGRFHFKKGKTPLHEAVLESDMPRLKEILSSFKDSWLNVKAKGGWTALHWATKSPDPELVRLLLHNNADPTLLTKEHNSVLHSAAFNGTVDIVKMLVETRRLDIDAQTKKGWTPIHCAIQSQKVDVLKFLIECKANIFVATEEGWLAFHLACKVGSLPCCQALLEATDSEHQQQMLSARTHRGWTPLFCAVNGMNGGHFVIVKWLVEEWRVPVDEPDDEEKMFTPLHIASRLGLGPIAEYLISQNANVNSIAKNGYTPLHWATLYNKEDIVDLLIANKADVNAQNRDKNTPLHVAKAKGHEFVYKKIVDAGADLSIRNADGFTPPEVTSEIPPEIRSRGELAIHHFREALQKGKTKPHRIKLMLLGDARVGKTSLFRYLTGQAFIEDLNSTEGIETTLISTSDVKPVCDRVWKVFDVSQSDFIDKVAQETVNRFKQDEAVASKPQSHPLIEELSSQDDKSAQESETPLEASRTLPRTETQVQNDALSTSAVVNTLPHLAVPSSQPTSTGFARKFPPQSSISRDARHNTSIRGQHSYRQTNPRHGSEGTQQYIHSNPRGQDASPAKKKKIRRKRKRREPEPLQHDLSELPMTKIKKHWQSSDTQDDETVKLSVWDFAGQPLYEPMHHIFLTRRAIYLIVLNLDKLTENGITDADMKQIHKWVASVHAHTSLEPEPVRLFFVGTHKDSKKAAVPNVNTAIQQIKRWFQQSKEFAGHIEYVAADDGGDDDDDDKILACIENSSPDFEDSNVCVLRKAILKAALSRSYMKEEIPLSWLQFEDRIIEFHQQSLIDQTEHEASRARPCLLTRDKMKEIAGQCNVDVSEGPFKTMITFFHDVGLIVVPAAMEGLDEEMKKFLEEFVIPNPQWLVDLMTCIVNIPKESKRDTRYRSDWLTLENEGILSHNLMHHVMHELHQFSHEDVRTLCILFQALGFICKLLHGRVDTLLDTEQLTEQMNQATLESSRDESNQQHNDPCRKDTHAETYLVPCQLPEDDPNIEELQEHRLKEEFYFDFSAFLPPWLFLHLIVRLCTHMQQQRDLQHSLKIGRLPLLSKKMCLMAQNLHTRFIIKPLPNRIIVCHQLNDCDAEKELMSWLFDVVADISKQKFKNLTFSVGHLCPHVSCLKKQIVSKDSQEEEEHHLRVFHHDIFKSLRGQGLPAVRCLRQFRRYASMQNRDGSWIPVITSINSVLSAAQNKGHVGEIFSYVNGDRHHEDHEVVCDFADPGVIAHKLSAAALKLLSRDHKEFVSKKDINLLAKSLADCSSFTPEYLAAALEIDIDTDDTSELVLKDVLKDVRKQYFKMLTRWSAEAGEKATIGYLKQAIKEAL